MFRWRLQPVGHQTLIIFGVCFLWCAWAHGSSLHVNPVRVALSPAQSIEAITVRNDDSQPALVQAQPFRWLQEDGKDIYNPSTELIAAPPIFTLQPGKTQIVRIGLRRPFPQQGELAYRLYFQEIPPEPHPKEQNLRVVLRIGLPVFVSGNAQTAPVLHWDATQKTSRAVEVNLKNTGNGHVRVTSLKLTAPVGSTVFGAQEFLKYLLPGQTHSWLINTATVLLSGAPVRLTAQTNVGEVYADLALSKP
jgi:fimbrial chaperone protein